MLWLYLHFPHLLLDHIRRAQPDTGPLAITDAGGQKVIQACPHARDLGIRPGMRLKTALGLAPELAIIRASDHQQERILEDQAFWLYRHAAHIVPVPPDGLLAEVGSLQRMYGSLDALWKVLEQALQERQLTAWPGTAHTPLAACLIARSGQGEFCSDKARSLHLLSQLPLTRAGLDERTCTRLQRLGLETLGQVFALPQAELARRLSRETLMRVQKILGTRADPQTPWQPPHRFRQQLDFAQDVERVQGLLFPLQRILSELEADLHWRQQDTDCLQLSLRHRHEQATRLRIRTSGPEHRAEAFLNLIRLVFERQPLKAPVISVHLSVQRFLDRQIPTGQDLLGQNGDPDEAWHTLVSRLQARLGDNALTQIVPQPDHRPELAWRALPVGHRHKAVPAVPGAHRPLWLLPEPQSLGETPRAWLSGPERIQAGWWDGQRVHRDYYIAQLHHGQLAWVFRDPGGDWFVHGWFG